MKEEKIDSIALISHSQRFLSGHEREVVTEFQQEMFEVSDKRFFELAF